MLIVLMMMSGSGSFYSSSEQESRYFLKCHIHVCAGIVFARKGVDQCCF